MVWSLQYFFFVYCFLLRGVMLYETNCRASGEFYFPSQILLIESQYRDFSDLNCRLQTVGRFFSFSDIVVGIPRNLNSKRPFVEFRLSEDFHFSSHTYISFGIIVHYISTHLFSCSKMSQIPSLERQEQEFFKKLFNAIMLIPSELDNLKLFVGFT